jgi:hypothetical protein
LTPRAEGLRRAAAIVWIRSLIIADSEVWTLFGAPSCVSWEPSERLPRRVSNHHKSAIVRTVLGNLQGEENG